MKFRIRMKFATDSMVIRFRELVGSLILSVFVLILIALLLLMNELNSNLREKLDQSFCDGCERIGYIQLNGVEAEEELDDFLLELNCIKAAGTWGLYSNTHEELKFLREIQGEHTVYEGNKNEEYIETVIVDSSAWNMFGIELLEGNPPEQYDMNAYTLIYLGYEYQNHVEVGTVISTTTETYLIAGIMEKGTLIPDDTLSLLDKFSITSAYSMDYEVVQVIQSPLGSPVYFSIKDGYSFEEVREEIQRKAEENNMSVTISSLDAKLSSIEESLKPVRQYMLQIILVVGLTTCIVFTCYQTMSIITRKREYGILYANGATTWDLIWIILIENAVKLLISIVIVLPAFMLLADKVFVFYYGDQYMIQWIIWEKIVWKIVLAGVSMTMLSSILPVYILKRYTPVTLIGGNSHD